MNLAQVLFNTLTRAGELGLIAIGLSMVYGIFKFANFSHNEFATVGAYLALAFKVGAGLNLLVSVILAIFLTGIVGILIDRGIFRLLRQAHPTTLMVTSIGLSISLRSIVQTVWGSDIRDYEIGVQPPLEIFGARVTPIRLWIVGTALLAMILFHLFLHRTKLGKAIRATSDNLVLAETSGIHTDRVILMVWFLGAAFAAVGGVLIGLETQLRPEMGWALLLPVFATAILGGIGNVYGAMLGALVIAAAENVGLALNFGGLLNLGGLFDTGDLFIPIRYKPAIAFIVLIITLLIRPGGILGRKER